MMSAEQAQSSGAKADPKANRQIRCGTCSMCTSSDCGECMNCLDMPKFGGPGHKKQACSKRKCLQLTPCKTRKEQLPPPKRQRADSGAAIAAGPAGMDMTADEAALVAESHHALADYLLGTASETDAGYGTPRGEDPIETAVLLNSAEGTITTDLDSEEPAGPAHDVPAPTAPPPALSTKPLSITTGQLEAYGMGLDSPPRARSPTASGLTTASAVGATPTTPAPPPPQLASPPKRPAVAGAGILSGSSPPSVASSLNVELQSVCAVTQDDVAATHRVQQLDAKLDWSWLALGNLEDEFIRMNDTHKGQHRVLAGR